MSKISPCLWFDGQAEEAAQLYTSLVPDSRRAQLCTYTPRALAGRCATSPRQV
jgi:predicted 3-demethylubiquinone-9 3-methyltransferase (glyoxalase superfamily)